VIFSSIVKFVCHLELAEPPERNDDAPKLECGELRIGRYQNRLFRVRTHSHRQSKAPTESAAPNKERQRVSGLPVRLAKKNQKEAAVGQH
jgi:hypothetical protein